MKNGPVDILRRLVQVPSYNDGMGTNEIPILELIEKNLAGFRTLRLPLDGDDKRWVLVVERGDGPRAWAIYNHIDTIRPTWPKPRFELEQEGDKLKGVGAYDMKAGAAVTMHHFLETPVQQGLKEIAIFAPDEELLSKGASSRALIEYLVRQNIIAILSPEIPTVPFPSGKQDIVIGRSGNAKFIGIIRTREAHGSDRSTVDANRVYLEIIKKMDQIVEAKPAHPLLGKEQFRPHSVNIPDMEGLSNSIHGVFQFKRFILPPDTCAGTLEATRQSIFELMRLHSWTENGVTIEVALRGDQTSYDPYISNVDTDAGKMIFHAADEVYGGFAQRGGDSVADGNILVPALRLEGLDIPYIEVAASGGFPHNPREYVSKKDILQNARFMKVSQQKLAAMP